MLYQFFWKSQRTLSLHVAYLLILSAKQLMLSKFTLSAMMRSWYQPQRMSWLIQSCQSGTPRLVWRSRGLMQWMFWESLAASAKQPLTRVKWPPEKPQLMLHVSHIFFIAIIFFNFFVRRLYVQLLDLLQSYQKPGMKNRYLGVWLNAAFCFKLFMKS